MTRRDLRRRRRVRRTRTIGNMTTPKLRLNQNTGRPPRNAEAARGELDAELQRVKQEKEVILESIADPFFALDKDGRISFLNQRAADLFARTKIQLIGRSLTDLLPYATWEMYVPHFEQVVRSQASVTFEHQFHPSGDWFEIHISPHQWGFSLLYRDIQHRKQVEDALWWRANYDSLTGLVNRDRMQEQISGDIADARQQHRLSGTERAGAILIIDLDAFKYINDSLGHDFGDRVLRAAAARFESTLARVLPHTVEAHLGRHGGDEFVIWLPELQVTGDQIQAMTYRLAHSLLDALSTPIQFVASPQQERELLITASVGIALYPEDGEDTDVLLRNAGIALHLAKETGRRKVRFHTKERGQRISHRLRLETRLRQAVQNAGLDLVYQPQVDMISRQVVGAEALVRWEDAELGTVSPDVFIPLAEEIGLIHALGIWALRTACRQVAVWRRDFHSHLRMSVNISALQMVETEMIAIIGDILRETGLPGDALELELTETALFLLSDKVASQFLNEIGGHGVRLAIDDFGTGYSSLAQLRRVPVDVVKIDRGFIADMAENRQSRAIVRAIIDLAHALGLSVTAEGVELQAQRDTLNAFDCDTIQGYLYSKPVSAKEMEELLRKAPWQ